MIIILYSYYLCSVLQYGDMTVVLFDTVITRMAFFSLLISLRCYSVRLLIGMVIIRASFFGTVISLRCYLVQLLLLRHSSVS